MSVQHGFIDESVRSDGWYRLTMVCLNTRDLAVISRSLRTLVPKGRGRLHFSAESDSRRRAILSALITLPIHATTFAAPYRRGDNEQPARSSCLRTLIQTLDANVVVLVLDSRGEHRDRQDRAELRNELVRTDRAETVTYSHRGSRDELLLALPDAIGWAVGAGGRFALSVRTVADVIEIGPESG